MAVQTALDKALVQWPFLHDTSLLSAITAVFMPSASPGGHPDAAKSAARAAAAGALDMALLQPWLYFNALLLNSQLFIPVLDKVRRLHRRRILSPSWTSNSQSPYLLDEDGA